MKDKLISISIVGMLVIGGFIGLFTGIDQVKAAGPTYVSGPITSDTTWNLTNSPYIVTGDVTVEPGFTLTIEPGVEVKFDGLYSLIVNGTLNGTGTPSLPIQFTSNQTTPGKGDWNQIRLYGANNILDYCEISFGNYPLFIMGINTYNQISNCTIINNTGDGIYLKETTNNTIYNTTVSFSQSNGITLLDSENNIIDNSFIRQNNAFGIYLRSSINNIIENTNLSNNIGGGIKLDLNSDHTQIKNITVFGNHDNGVDFGGNSNNKIINSQIIDNDGTGIDFGGVSEHQWIENCTIRDNSGSGIDLKGSSYADIIDCNVSKNKGNAGIYSESSVTKISITNSVILNNSGDGIKFYRASNVDITNSNISRNGLNGIIFNGSNIQENNTIQNCTTAENGNNGILIYAFSLFYLDFPLNQYNTISHNLIYSNIQDGIRFQTYNYHYSSKSYIQYNKIFNNIIYLNNQDGIHFYIHNQDYGYIQYNYIHNNTIYSNNQNGIHLNMYCYYYYYYNNYILYNNIYNNLIFSNNLHGICYNVRDMYGRGYYYIQHNNIFNNTIFSNNQNGLYFALYSITSFEYNNIYYNNIYQNSQNGIYFYYGESYSFSFQYNNLFSNFIYSNALNGIYFYSSPWGSLYLRYNNIYFNAIYSNNQNGIYLKTDINYWGHIQFNNIFKNTIYSNNKNGINLFLDTYYNGHIFFEHNEIYSNVINMNTNGSGIFAQSNNITREWDPSDLYNNTIFSNLIGIEFIRIQSQVVYSNNISNNINDGILLNESTSNTFRGNTILNNNWTGIYLINSSHNNTIVNNNIASNNQTGISILENSTNNRIIRNEIMNNSAYGVNITNSTDNLIHHNNFRNNKQNAYDSTNMLNDWDDGAEGNWWDDYTGFDSDGDGIGDIPYDVPGGGNKDWYPLINSVNITKPWVETTTPLDGAVNISVSPLISITFSKEMNKSATENSISISGGITPTNFTWSNGNRTLTFELTSTLDSTTTYTVTISTDAQDLLGNHLESSYEFSFTTEDVVGPRITSTSPINGEINIAFNADVIVTFSEAMNTSSVTFTCSPDPRGWSATWSGGNTLVTYSHNDFGSAINYTFQITAGKDVAGNDLIAGAVPNPWSFTTIDIIGPEITSTSPIDGQIDVLLTANIVVTFNEQMNTSSVTFTCTSDPGGWSSSWSNGDKTVTYSHNAFNSQTVYTFQITGGKDLAGNNLNPSAIPNPWTYTTLDTIQPQIIVTSPLDGEINVALNANITVTFNEPMNPATVTKVCTPDPGGWSVTWSGGDTMATYSHASFNEKSLYTFQITFAKDVAGNNLVAGIVPNPWSFTTGDFTAPQIIATSPQNQSIDVPLGANVIVTFSEAMNDTTITYTCLPDPGGWSITWSGGNTVATISHNPFDSSTIYTFQITGGKDLAGNDLVGSSIPNPWTFSTEDALAPTIISTSPINGSSNVVQTENIVATFSEAMNVSSITYICSPNPGGWTVSWSVGDTVATFLHNPFDSNTIYTFQITGGKDIAENSLISGIVPNPWSFTTTDTTAPSIISTSPISGAKDIGLDQDVIVIFSEAMNTSSVTYIIFPDPGGWSVSWSGGDTVATFSHNAFNYFTIYTFQIINAKDVLGNNLIAGTVPNPWTFITLEVTPPEIIATSPPDGTTNIALTTNVVVTFSEEMNPTTVSFLLSPDPGGWSASWNVGNTTVTYSHNTFDEMTSYTFQITGGQDIAGNNLTAGAVPNPWSFTTGDFTGPKIIATIPSDGTFNIGLDQDIIVTFSEAMDNNSVIFTCLPDPSGWSVIWSGVNTVATFSHNPFNEFTIYSFQIAGGKDIAGNNLIAGSVPNPWVFTTMDATSPTIIATSPSNTAIDIALTASIVVTFSEEMEPTTVSFLCIPDPGGWFASWNIGNTTVTYSHNTFDEMTSYTFQITSGQDIAGNDLVAGAVPNPWSFKTGDFTAPQIIATSPMNNSIDVPLSANIVVTFSEAMNTTSVTYICLPDQSGWSITWSGGNTVATFSHNPFDESTMFSFQITSCKDVAGNSLVTGSIPNPWTFTTLEVTPPEIIATSPPDGTTNIALTTNIVVIFSEGMRPTTVSFLCIPDPSGWSASWNVGNTTVTYSHNAFDEITSYTFQITGGQDIAGNDLVAGAVPNPWSFTTGDFTGPKIVATIPSDGTFNIGLDQDIIVTFSEAMDNNSVIFTCLPDPSGWSVIWSGVNTVATFSHNPFNEFTKYSFQIAGGKDIAGNILIAGSVPNPWVFTTMDAMSPMIIATSPLNTAIDIALSASVVVTFSEQMNPTTVSFLCIPDPGGWSASWNAGNTTVTYSHDTFNEMTIYTFQIIAGKDIAGNDFASGVIPNPWQFTTIDTNSPVIISTWPSNTAINIALITDVTVMFSEAMNSSSVSYICTPDPDGWSAVWSNDDKTAIFSHNAFNSSTTYIFQITAGKDVYGNSLVANTVPNPWLFTTIDVTSPTIIATSPSNDTTDITLTSDIIITFSEPMNISSISFLCSPNPGGWAVSWSNGDRTVTYSHNAFEELTTYSFQIIAGKDVNGNDLTPGSIPNPWLFVTIDSEGPNIVSTSPFNGASNIGLDQDIIVTLSEQIDVSSITYSCEPDPGGWGISWNTGNTVATFSHNLFTESTMYTFQIINARDLGGNNLIIGTIPNPWAFTTTDTTQPTIINTIPGEGEGEVASGTDFIITFSEPIEPNSLMYSCAPDPGGWRISWSNDNTIAIFSHDPFEIGSSYTFQITAAKDMAGNNLSLGPVPQSWDFTTISIDSMILSPSEVNILVNETMVLIAQAYDSQNNPIPDITYVWSVNNDLGSISPQGLQITTFKAASIVGICYVNVTAGGKSATTIITIKSEDLVEEEPENELPEYIIWIWFLIIVIFILFVINLWLILRRGTKGEESLEPVEEEALLEDITDEEQEISEESENSSSPSSEEKT